MPIFNAAITDADQIENLRLGTRKQYVSPWSRIKAGQFLFFEHGLNEVPVSVNICVSEDSGGGGRELATDVVVEYTDLGQNSPGNYNRGSESTHIKLTNFGSSGPDGNGLYFQLRAM